VSAGSVNFGVGDEMLACVGLIDGEVADE